MEKINVSDIGEIANSQDYKHAGLYDSAGRCMVALNSNKVPLTQKLEQIKKRLSGQKEGFFTVRFQHNIGKKFPVYDYLVQKGNLSEAPAVITPAVNNQTIPKDEQVRGWNEALKDKEEIALLRSENTRLKAIEISLQEEEDEEEDEEEKPLTENTTISAIKEIVPQFLPLAEKFFEQRDRELSLREKELEFKYQRRQVPTENLKSAHPFRPIPAIEDEKFAAYCNWLKDCPDDIFNLEMNFLEKNAAPQFEVCKKIFFNNEQEK